MTKILSESKTQTFCLIILAAVSVTSALIYTKSILVPFVFSVFLYSVALPIVQFFQERAKLPRPIAIVATVVLSFLMISLLSYSLASSVENFAAGASEYRLRLLELVESGSRFAAKWGYSFEPTLIKSELQKLPAFDFVKKATGGAFSFVGNLSLILIFFLFLIMGEGKPRKKSLISEIQQRISKYVSTKFLLSLVTGLLSGLVLVFCGVELAFMFATLTVLLNFIPNVGSMIAVLLPVPVLLLQFGFGWQLTVVLVLTGLIQVAIGNVLEPKMMGESMDLHPVTILMFLMFWGLVWGVPGMFLAVPITAILKIILSRIEPTKGLAEFLAGRF